MDDMPTLASRPTEGMLDDADDGMRAELGRLEQLQAEAQELFYRLASAIAPVLRPDEGTAIASGRATLAEREGRQRAELSTIVVEAQHRQHALIAGLRDALDRVNL